MDSNGIKCGTPTYVGVPHLIQNDWFCFNFVTVTLVDGIVLSTIEYQCTQLVVLGMRYTRKG